MLDDDVASAWSAAVEMALGSSSDQEIRVPADVILAVESERPGDVLKGPLLAAVAGGVGIAIGVAMTLMLS